MKLSRLLYPLIRRLQMRKRKDFIISDASLSPEEKAQRYFAYEYEKAPGFFSLFDCDFAGKTVLEIGTNVGGYLFYVIEKYPEIQRFYGVEIDAEKSEFARKRLAAFPQVQVLNRDARDLAEVPDCSVDLVYSDAVIEHIKDLPRLFAEIHRVLKPGGRAVLATSPIWKAWNGGHIYRYFPIPWIHLLLPDQTILNMIELMKKDDVFPKDALDAISEIYATMGKLTLRKLKRAIRAQGFEFKKFDNITTSRSKKMLQQLPYFGEFFAGNIVVHLVKTDLPADRG